MEDRRCWKRHVDQLREIGDETPTNIQSDTALPDISILNEQNALPNTDLPEL